MTMADMEYKNGALCVNELNISGVETYSIDSDEWADVKLDSSNKILYGVTKDGDFSFGCGVPSKIKEELDKKADKGGYQDVAETIRKLKNGEKINTDILYFNPENEVTPKLENLKRRYIPSDNYYANPPVFSLIHYSDVHHDNENILRIKEFYDKYSEHINVVLNTGDHIGGQITQGLPEVTPQIPDVLRVIGNHDTSIRIGTPPNHHWDFVGQIYCYNVNYSDYMQHWVDNGVIQPTGVDDASSNYYCACYYYKDFNDSSVRLICTDGEHWGWPADASMGSSPGVGSDNTQLTWFYNTLLDAREKGLHVICAVHRLPFTVTKITGNTFDSVEVPSGSGGVKTLGGSITVTEDEQTVTINGAVGALNRFMNTFVYGARENWEKIERVSASTYESSTTYNVNDIVNVQEDSKNSYKSLITQTNNYPAQQLYGHFVCWLCGHLHQDTMGLGNTEETKNQLVVSIDCATSGSSATVYSEQDRKYGTKTQDCFNIVGVDTTSKMLKLIRIGAEYDCYMRRKNTLCWQYEQKTLIYCD